MGKAESHHTEQRGQRRSFYGEPLGAPVAEFLNQQGATGRRKRIIALLLELLELSQHSTPTGGFRYLGSSKELLRIGRVNQRLTRYRTSPMLWPANKRGSGLVPFWSFKESPSTKRKAEFLECEAARNLIQLADMGLLGSLRQCECDHKRNRGQWFFARISHQKFCSEECRIRYNQTTPQARAYRAQKSREYYKREKELEAKAERQARHGRV